MRHPELCVPARDRDVTGLIQRDLARRNELHLEIAARDREPVVACHPGTDGLPSHIRALRGRGCGKPLCRAAMKVSDDTAQSVTLAGGPKVSVPTMRARAVSEQTNTSALVLAAGDSSAAPSGQGHRRMRVKSLSRWVFFVLVGCLCFWDALGARAADLTEANDSLLAWTRCPQCALEVGTGTTFVSSHWTDGIAVPLLLEIDRSRWEIGAYRFLTRQFLNSPAFPPSTISAQPFWAFSTMHRWQILHRSRWKLYAGLGASYQTQIDLLDATKWNFAFLLACRYSLGRHLFLEFSARHWSNAWIKMPNRGQDLVLISVGVR